MNSSNQWGRFLAVAAMLVLSAGAVTAQLQTGNLYGKVRDQTGAALPGVTVTLDTGEAPQIQVTNAQGEFRFLSLPPANYKIKAELQGFSLVEYPYISINVGRNTNIEVTMKQPPTPTPQEHGMAPRQPGKAGETSVVDGAVLIATGKIKVETSGSGETIGHIADLKIQNLTGQPLTCAIAPMILESGSGKNQDYACPVGQTVALNPHQTKTVPMNGVCLNRDKPPVGKGVSGDLVINEANPAVPQNPNSHIAPKAAGDLLRICTSKYDAADKLQKDGALKALPYKDKQKQKDIVVQWSTWCDPRISQITGAPPATKEDLRKVVYKQVPQPMTPAKKKKVDEGIDAIFSAVELTSAKAKELEMPATVAAETAAPVSTPTPTATPTPTPDEQSLKDCVDAAKKKMKECEDEADKQADRCYDKCKKDFPIGSKETAETDLSKQMGCLGDCAHKLIGASLVCQTNYARDLEDCIKKHLAEGGK